MAKEADFTATAAVTNLQAVEVDASRLDLAPFDVPAALSGTVIVNDGNARYFGPGPDRRLVLGARLTFQLATMQENKMSDTTVAVAKVLATPAAEELIERLRTRHGPLLFHQSGGCCDGSSPMCFAQDDFIVGDRDVKLGEIAGVAFYMNPAQYEYWKHTQLIIDVVEGRGGMFSLENGEGVRFLTRSRLFTDDEIKQLIREGRF